MEITQHRQKILDMPDSKPEKFDDCLILKTDSEIDGAALSLILERLNHHSSEGHFSAKILVNVLDEVEEILRRKRAFPAIEEVAGAWGELNILHMLLNSTNSAATQRAILAGWEGETRQKLDFKFIYAMQVLEIKTTMSDKRIHHLHGIDQVTIPPGFDYGALASLCVQTGRGFTCAQFVKLIKVAATGTETEIEKFGELLATRILVRGRTLCEDERFSFELIENGLQYCELDNVPKPGEAEGVTPIEWLSDLTDVEMMKSEVVHTLINRIMTDLDC